MENNRSKKVLLIIVILLGMISMRFIVDGRVDIRPLDKQDKAHEDIPYNDIVINKEYSFSSPLNNGATRILYTFTSSDWGAGKTLVVKSLSAQFFSVVDGGSTGHITLIYWRDSANTQSGYSGSIFINTNSIADVYGFLDVAYENWLANNANYESIMAKKLDVTKQIVTSSEVVHVEIVNQMGNILKDWNGGGTYPDKVLVKIHGFVYDE